MHSVHLLESTEPYLPDHNCMLISLNLPLRLWSRGLFWANSDDRYIFSWAPDAQWWYSCCLQQWQQWGGCSNWHRSTWSRPVLPLRQHYALSAPAHAREALSAEHLQVFPVQVRQEREMREREERGREGEREGVIKRRKRERKRRKGWTRWGEMIVINSWLPSQSSREQSKFGLQVQSFRAG